MKFSRHVCACAVLAASGAWAAPATFTIDPAGTSVTISGTIAGAPITQQGPGSLTTTYFGTGLAELTPTTVQFINGGSAVANNSGNWQPAAGGIAGFAPANYGGRVSLGIFGTGLLAIRNLSVDASSDPLALTGTTFPASGATVVTNTGTADFNSTLFTGSEDLAGTTGSNSAAGNGALSIAVNTGANTGTATLTLPLQATLVADIAGIGQATLNFNGQLLGRVTSIGGDANFDKIVDIGDFATLAANFNLPGSWLAGNFDDVGLIDIGDFAILAANFNRTAPRSAVPEPAGIIIALGAALFVARFGVGEIVLTAKSPEPGRFEFRR